MLFASLVFEREPMQWSQFPDAFGVWLQNAGAAAAFGIILVLIARALQRNPNELALWNFSSRMQAILPALKACIIAAGVGYAMLIVLWTADRVGVPGLKRFIPRENPFMFYTIGDWVLTLSGSLALVVVLAPIVIDFVSRISWYRIWAIARLSWKEAIRGRVIWVVALYAPVFLFSNWFVSTKPEDQVRSFVLLVYLAMTILFLITAALLGSFSIPNDVKNNSIHTIVTKPVEKFEIVLGRFLGYAGLLTIGLALVAGLSLIFVVRGISEEAEQESYKARVAEYGRLQFAGTKDTGRGQSVGREFEYRSYITGPTQFRREAFRQYAIWDFADIPAAVRQQDGNVIFEFAFDIFRLSKGIEGKGVFCSFAFAAATNVDAQRQAQEMEGKVDEIKKKREKLQNLADKNIADATERKKEYERIEKALVEEFGIYAATPEVSAVEVTDFHTQTVAVPAEEFQALLAENAKAVAGEKGRPPALRVFVSVDISREAQMVGVAPHDFYLLVSVKPFWQNFLKGVIGMWCTHMLVLGIAIACSTYLTSVISLLITMFLLVAGLFLDYLRDIAERRVDGGGPFQSAMRITTKMSPAAPLDDTPTMSVLRVFDNFFSWWVGRILNVIPDINRHDLHQYVANGFDIGWTDVLFLDNVVPMVGYLAPWAILAYYLMKYREIANPS